MDSLAFCDRNNLGKVVCLHNLLLIPREARYQIPVVRAPFVNPVPVRVRGMNSSQSKFFWPSFLFEIPDVRSIQTRFSEPMLPSESLVGQE